MLWTDGRSGAAGCVAGNFVLSQLNDGTIKRLKGTMFESSSALLIGRVCATDEYLQPPIVHWANASWDQHVEMKQDAAAAGKKLAYLFITASSDPAEVRYWRVPGSVVEAAFELRCKNKRGDTCAVHISAEKSNYYVGKVDVTKYFKTVEVNPAQARRLRDA